MQYYSLNNKAPRVLFKEAVIKGLAPDNGLYFPSEIVPFDDSFFVDILDMTHVEIAFNVIKPYVGGDIPDAVLKDILKDVLDFDFPVVEIKENIYALELYHGPTLAFKDVGARFMARCLGYFNEKDAQQEEVTVLVATSGDTGGAVASGFYEVPGVEVVILYPSGKVSEIQEKQLTTMGKNISAIEVEGTFDDCQAMVKKAFLDGDFKGKRKLTSANSINVARWLPQMFYYFFTYKALKKHNKEIVFSVPSGNYGNICAGMMAQKMGLPISHFVTGTNANNTVPHYLKVGDYRTKPSVATISNAMDVGAPSNFIRIQEIYNNDIAFIRLNLSGYSFTDDETRNAMHYLFKEYNYISDPHGAIGYAALEKYVAATQQEFIGVFLETAHPVKFLDVLPLSLKKEVQIPESIQQILNKKKSAKRIAAYSELKTFLLK